MYIQSMNDGLSDDIKKELMLPLTIEQQDHKEKVFHNTPVSSIIRKNVMGEIPQELVT